MINKAYKGIKNPKKAYHHIKSNWMSSLSLNRKYHKMLNSEGYYRKGVDVFSESWDNLIILDACRHDLFIEQHRFDVDVEKKFSRGSNTWEFLHANLDGKKLHDTVYITANPMYTRIKNQSFGWAPKIESEFYDVIDIWDNVGWSEEHKTVLPSTVNKAVINNLEKYPNKRLFIHYLQPHWPFINSGWEEDRLRYPDPDNQGRSIWNLLKQGETDLTKSEVWKAYAKNLDIALKQVEDILDLLEGKTVISSDHGNLLGERGGIVPGEIWGHPNGIYVDGLVKVPWVEIQNGPRRNIFPEEPLSNKDNSEIDTARDRLKQLGYLES